MINESDFYDATLERRLCWLVLSEPKRRPSIFRAVRGEYFSEPACRKIFEAAFSLFAAGKDGGMVEVEAVLSPSCSVQQVIGECEHSYGDPAPLIERLREFHARRSIRRVLTVALDALGTRPALDIARTVAAESIREIGAVGMEKEMEPAELVSDALARYASPERGGLSTGIRLVDEWTGGLIGGRLYVLAGSKKTGKTRAVTSIMYAVALAGVPCTFFSLEMRPAEITDLLFAKVCNINSGRIQNKKLTTADQAAIARAAGDIKGVLDSLHLISPAAVTPAGLEAMIRLHVSFYHVKVVAIDFMTKIAVDRHNENTEYGQVCAMLSAVARELDISIILVCQLNKQADTSDIPNLSHVEGTGRISQFADAIILLVNDTRTGRRGPDAAEVQGMRLHITQRQGLCSEWIPITARLQVLDFQNGL